jgi:hypothetical protein
MHLTSLLFLLCLLASLTLSQKDSQSSLVKISPNGEELTQEDKDTLQSEADILSNAGLSGMMVLGGQGIRKSISPPLDETEFNSSTIVSAFTSAIVFIVRAFPKSSGFPRVDASGFAYIHPRLDAWVDMLLLS